MEFPHPIFYHLHPLVIPIHVINPVWIFSGIAQKDIFDKPNLNHQQETPLWNLVNNRREPAIGKTVSLVSWLHHLGTYLLPNELKRCTSLNACNHKIKEYFFYRNFFCAKYYDRKITTSVVKTKLLSPQPDNIIYLSSTDLMHFFSHFRFFKNFTLY